MSTETLIPVGERVRPTHPRLTWRGTIAEHYRDAESVSYPYWVLIDGDDEPHLYARHEVRRMEVQP